MDGRIADSDSDEYEVMAPNSFVNVSNMLRPPTTSVKTQEALTYLPIVSNTPSTVEALAARTYLPIVSNTPSTVETLAARTYLPIVSNTPSNVETLAARTYLPVVSNTPSTVETLAARTYLPVVSNTPSTVETVDTLEPLQAPQKKGKGKGKKKGIFRRISRGKHDSKKIQTLYQDSSSGSPASTQSRNKLVVAKTIPTEREHAISSPAAPTLGPKPPRRLSEEEMLTKIRQRQKKTIETARMDRLRRSSVSDAQQRAQSEEYVPDYTLDHSYGELEVEDILDQYSNHLPLEVVVSKGIYGMEERYSLSTADRCVIHFIKRRELVQIHDPKTNKEFSVPVNSAIKFAVVFNPHSDESQALGGLEFPCVSDILAETVMPKIGIAHLKDPDVIGMKSIEVLVIKEVIFPANPMEPRKLRVYSLTANCQRDLPETQEIRFTTKPSFMQLYLTDILKHVPNPCPLHVAMYRDPLGRPLIAPGMPGSMFRRPLYLKKRYTDILLIATGCSSGEGGEENSQPFEIPTDIDVEFQVVKLSSEEKDKLIQESKALQEKFKEKDLRHHRYVGVSDEEHRMQLSLYKSTREGSSGGEGGATGGSSGKGGATAADEWTDEGYVRATSGNRLAINHRVELLEENMKRCSHSLAEAKVTIATINKDNAVLSDKLRDLEEIVAGQKHQLDQVEAMELQLNRVFAELDQVSANLGGVKVEAAPTTSAPTTFDVTYERNKKLLFDMNKAEVSRMLDLAGLGQHVEKLEAECVSGDILAECNDEMLETELGVKSKLHRLKLLRIIEGKASEELYRLAD